MAVDAIALPEKPLPRLCIDLEDYPELEGDVDDIVEFRVRGRICSKQHSDYCKTQDIECKAIYDAAKATPTVGPLNEADKALGKLKAGRQMGRY